MKTESAFHPVVSSNANVAGSHSFPKASTNTNTISDGADHRPILWVFELKDDGTVIYTRPRTEGKQASLKGQNFFDEVAGFEDIAKYRQHFHSFVKKQQSSCGFCVASFVRWQKHRYKGLDDAGIPDRFRPTGVVMMEIRDC